MPELQQGTLNESVMDRAFMLILRFGRFGTSKKANLGVVEVDADKRLLSLSKRLLKCEEYDRISKHDREVKKWIETIAVPFPISGGCFLIPIPKLEEVQEGLERHKEMRQELIDAFVAVYPDKVREIETDLRDLYNASDYPDVDDVRERFSFDWQFQDYGVPGRLRQLNARMFQQENEKLRAKIQEASNLMQQAMRADLFGYVSHMAKILKPGEDGKKRTFKESSVTQLKEFVEGFATRNLTNDTELDALVKQAKDLLDGVDADQIRSQDALRDALAVGFQQIADSMDGMVTDRTRRIILPSPSHSQPESDDAPADDERATA